MMAQATREKSAFGAAFEDFSREAAEDPSWLRRLREEAIERFEQRGFPTTDEEDWKYTNVAPIARQTFTPALLIGPRASALTARAIAPHLYEEARRSRLEIGRASCRERA